MRKLPKRTFNPIFGLLLIFALFIMWLSACSTAPETVEVTRVVTETEVVEVEGETVEVEVTRVVTETVTETVELDEVDEEIEESAEDEPAPPLATGSEDDSGPFPPPPDDGPKITSRDDTTVATAGNSGGITLETAVAHRANSTQPANNPTTISVNASNAQNSINWQHLCQQVAKIHKKRCS